MKKLTHEEIVLRQRKRILESRLPFCAVLNNIRSLYNVGAIFRTADGAGLEKLWLTGITGSPPAAQIAKTALGAQDRMPWEYCPDVVSLLRELKSQQYQIVLLEQVAGSVDYEAFVPQAPLCLVVGNEVSGVSDDVVTICDVAVEIEMRGVKNSLNVSVAFGIAAYQMRKFFLKKC